MLKHKFRFFALLLLLGAVGGFSSPAIAGYKVAVVEVKSGAPDPSNTIGTCISYTFESEQAAHNCVTTISANGAGKSWLGMSSYGFAAKYKAQDGTCKQRGGNTSVTGNHAGEPGVSDDASPYAQAGFWLRTKWMFLYPATDTLVPNEPIYTDSACTAQASLSNRLWFRYTLTVVSDEGGPGPDLEPHVPEEDCLLPYSWAEGAVSYPDGVTVGSTWRPVVGQAFRMTFSDTQRRPYGKDNAGALVAGSVFKVGSCTMWRKVQLDMGAGLYYNVIEYQGTPEPETPVGDGSGAPTGNVVPGATKIANPVVQYGTEFDEAGMASVEATIDQVLAERERALMQSLVPQLAQLSAAERAQKLQVVVECQRPIGGGCILPYHHPAPQQLKRDHPEAPPAYDPRRAWNPSPTQPATPETPVEDLVRMSNDGQTVVHNNTAIYTDTRYPKTMVDAGSAPDNGQDDGSADNPADGEDVDGGGSAELEACLEGAECDVTQEHINSYLDAIGVDRDKDQSSEGVARRILGDAIEKGKCTNPNNNSGFCGLVAAANILAERQLQVEQDGPFVYWKGEIMGHEEEASFPDWMLDLIETLLKISTAISGIFIILRGRGI